MPTGSDSGLAAHEVDAGYDGRAVVHNLSLRLEAGDSVAVIGPNGAGKSTLLKVLSGLLRPRQGQVTLDGRCLSDVPRRERAKRIAVVPQSLDIGFGLTGRDVVMLGRTPYLGFLGTGSRTDREAVSEAIAETDVAEFVDRPFATLSGGEAQRVVLAMALAQETPYLLLDEPTVHLDLGQQWRLLELLVSLRVRRRVGILAIVHDLSLAGLEFNRVVLMSGGRIVAIGPAREVLTAERVRDAFGAPVSVWEDTTGVRVVLNSRDNGALGHQTRENSWRTTV